MVSAAVNDLDGDVEKNVETVEKNVETVEKNVETQLLRRRQPHSPRIGLSSSRWSLGDFENRRDRSRLAWVLACSDFGPFIVAKFFSYPWAAIVRNAT